MDMPKHRHTSSTAADPLERWAKALGYSGWLPVAALLAAALIDDSWQVWATRVATIYVATIFCFLGGIQWGFALHSSHPHIRVRRLFVSILPSLWAMIALLLPARLSIVALVVGQTGWWGTTGMINFVVVDGVDHVGGFHAVVDADRAGWPDHCSVFHVRLFASMPRPGR